jgi:hypothetical protein
MGYGGNFMRADRSEHDRCTASSPATQFNASRARGREAHETMSGSERRHGDVREITAEYLEGLLARRLFPGFLFGRAAVRRLAALGHGKGIFTGASGRARRSDATELCVAPSRRRFCVNSQSLTPWLLAVQAAPPLRCEKIHRTPPSQKWR